MIHNTWFEKHPWLHWYDKQWQTKLGSIHSWFLWWIQREIMSSTRKIAHWKKINICRIKLIWDQTIQTWVTKLKWICMIEEYIIFRPAKPKPVPVKNPNNSQTNSTMIQRNGKSKYNSCIVITSNNQSIVCLQCIAQAVTIHSSWHPWFPANRIRCQNECQGHYGEGC